MWRCRLSRGAAFKMADKAMQRKFSVVISASLLQDVYSYWKENYPVMTSSFFIIGKFISREAH